MCAGGLLTTSQRGGRPSKRRVHDARSPALVVSRVGVRVLGTSERLTVAVEAGSNESVNLTTCSSTHPRTHKRWVEPVSVQASGTLSLSPATRLRTRVKLSTFNDALSTLNDDNARN